MKRILLALVIAVATLIFVSPPGFVAADTNPLFEHTCTKSTSDPDTSASPICSDNKTESAKNNSFYGKDGILTKATSIIALVVGIAAVIVIIIGGLKYVLSNGDSNAINSAKNTILYAVIGLLVVVVARGIILFVINKL